MTAPRPTKYPEWASVAQNDPNAPVPAPNIFEPTDAQKQLGWFYQQPPPSNVMNWLQNLAYQWIEYLDQTVTGLAGFQTGDPCFKPYTIANTPAGWVAADGTTIGSSGSSANYKGTDYQALFTVYWNNIDDTHCPVSGGRGASALDDWNANKTLQMLQHPNRTIVNAIGSGAPIGSTAGNSTVILSANNNGIHAHAGSLTNANIVCYASGGKAATGGGNPWGQNVVGVNIGNSGNSTPFSTLSPCLYYNLFIKL